jgi:hypothetical protein
MTLSSYFAGGTSWILELKPLPGDSNTHIGKMSFNVFVIYCLSAISVEKYMFSQKCMKQTPISRGIGLKQPLFSDSLPSESKIWRSLIKKWRKYRTQMDRQLEICSNHWNNNKDDEKFIYKVWQRLWNMNLHIANTILSFC